MADRVQNVIERMLPELEALKEQSIFNDKEIKAIIDKR
jgi:hypothetical protein